MRDLATVPTDSSGLTENWPRDSDELIAAMVARGVDRGLGVYGGIRGGKNRLGDVDVVVLLRHGELNLKLGEAVGEVELLVWRDEGLAVWGPLRDLDAAAAAVHLWSVEADAEMICSASFDLRHDDGAAEAAAIEAQWSFLLRHGHSHFLPIARPVSQVPVLRRLKPWSSHGTLHLLERNFLQERKRQMILHPAHRHRWMVRSTSPESTSSPISTREAVALAADIAARWARTVA